MRQEALGHEFAPNFVGRVLPPDLVFGEFDRAASEANAILTPALLLAERTEGWDRAGDHGHAGYGLTSDSERAPAKTPAGRREARPSGRGFRQSDQLSPDTVPVVNRRNGRGSYEGVSFLSGSRKSGRHRARAFRSISGFPIRVTATRSWNK
jgi:hypothetical protein